MNEQSTSGSLTFTAVCCHEVMALTCEAQNAGPAHVDLIRRQSGNGVIRRLPEGRLYMGIRAGRATFASADGADPIGVTLLGKQEASGLVLGDPWPPSGARAHRGKIVDGLAAAVRGLGRAAAFPYTFPKAIRSSGERNESLAALASWCRREMPDTHVLYNAQHGPEHAVDGQLPAGHYKGLIGAPGWEDEESDPDLISHRDIVDPRVQG